MDVSARVTAVTTVWGDYDRYTDWWLNSVTGLHPRPRVIFVHGPPVEPRDMEHVTWVHTTDVGIYQMSDLGVSHVTTPWVWLAAIDDIPTQAGWDELHRVPDDKDSMLISATFLDGSGRWDSDPGTLLGPISAYRMCGGCPFTVDLFERAGGYSNPPELDHLHEWGWYLRCLAAGVRWHDSTHVVGFLTTYNPDSVGRTTIDFGVQERQAHDYARALGLVR